MNILSAKWANPDSTAAEVITPDRGAVFATPERIDEWAALQDWIAAGNTPEPADPVPVPAVTVTPRQIRLALNATGLRASVEAYVAAASQDVKDSWEYSTVFERDHPLLVAAGQGLGKSEAEIDALFALAGTL